MRHFLGIAAFLFACAPPVQPPAGSAEGDAGPSQPAVDARPIVTTNGALSIAAEPASPCGAWLPGSISDAAAPPAGSWVSLYSDGAGDLAATYHDEKPVFAAPLNIQIFPADGGAPIDRTADSAPLATPSGFMWLDTTRGPCMVCDTGLIAWPSTKGISIGDGYPWHGYCDWTPRPLGGVDAVCQRDPFMGQGGYPPFLAQFDERLAELRRSDDLKSAPVIVAVDRLDRIVESGSGGQRWIDADASPLSDWFKADATGALPLIGGGLVTTNDLLIPSGSSDVQPAPAWLKGRAGRGDIVLGGRAYAFPDGACGARLYDSEGDACGSVSVSGCSSLRFGLDGSLFARMSDGRWQVWSGLLR